MDSGSGLRLIEAAGTHLQMRPYDIAQHYEYNPPRRRPMPHGHLPPMVQIEGDEVGTLHE